jgi:DNA modification methylase
MDHLIIEGDSLATLPTLDPRSFHCCVMSPPYWKQRDYKVKGQIGLEKELEPYLDKLVAVFDEVARVLRPDGTMFVVIGDTYDGGRKMGIPERLAMKLVGEGWRWVDSIIWVKAQVADEENAVEGGCMPGSYESRCTLSYEIVLHMDRGRGYFDRDGSLSASGSRPRNVWRINTESNPLGHFALMPRRLAERCIRLGTSDHGCCPRCLAPWRRLIETTRKPTRPGTNSKINRASAHEDSPHHDHGGIIIGNRDKHRHVTVIETVGWEPGCDCGVDEVEPCRVIDPFGGLATTAIAARKLGRSATVIELNPKYCEAARRRLAEPSPPPSRCRKPLLVSDGLRDVLRGRIRRGRTSIYKLSQRSGVHRSVIHRFVDADRDLDISLSTADRLFRALDLAAVPKEWVRELLDGRAE